MLGDRCGDECWRAHLLRIQTVIDRTSNILRNSHATTMQPTRAIADKFLNLSQQADLRVTRSGA
jgi:hypothetical protein